MKNGTVYWITGLSNSGKTTLAKLLVAHLRAEGVAAVHLDGDDLRAVYGDGGGYDPQARKQIAFRNGRLCALLAAQGFTVVCSTISLFHSVQEWNRQNIPRYKEIFVHAPLDTRRKRDARKVYDDANVAGLHFDAEEPKHPDVILANDDQVTPERLFAKLIEGLQ